MSIPMPLFSPPRPAIRIVQAACISTALLLAPAASFAAPPLTTGAAPNAAALAPKSQPRVVASTSWVAAFAKAAGIADVTLVAPANLQHPPDYDPKPSDLAAIAKADYVLVAGFEGFATRMKEASGSPA